MRYAEMERRLAAAFRVVDSECRVGAFRGRLKHFMRLGLPIGCKPGRGSKVDHTDDHLWQFGLALELQALGLSPMVAVELVRAHWPAPSQVEAAYIRLDLFRGPGQERVTGDPPSTGESYLVLDMVGLRGRLGVLPQAGLLP